MKSVVIGTAGHIDHGKSALVRALTGTDPDRLKEEQARGITIDLGFAHLVRDDVQFAFVDVPGHERFVRNMLAGAGGIDLVMLVIAADESVMPQTREHFQICRLLHVPAGLVVLTKKDLADADMIGLATLEARELVQGSFLADAPILAVSSKTNEGLPELLAALRALAEMAPSRRADGPARLPIDRVFTMKGFGTVVTGTLVSGRMREEAELIALPRELPVKVRGVQVHGRRESEARAGQRVAANLGGIEVSDLTRGDTLCEPGAFEATQRVDVVLDLLPDVRALRHGARVRFHQGTSELLGRVAIAASLSGRGGSAEVAPGDSVYARFRLESRAVVTRGDRFIVRAYSPPLTIGGGVVLDPHPPRSAIRTAAGVGRFRRLAGTPEDAAVAFVEERGGAGLSRAVLIRRAGLSRDEARALVDRLEAAGRAIAVDEELLAAPAVLDALAVRLLDELGAHHRAQPLADGLPREEARERIFGRASPAVFDFVLRRLVAERRIVARDWLAIEGHRVSLSPEEARAEEALGVIYRNAKLAPPDPASAAAGAGAAPDVADRVMKLLLKRRTLVKLDTLYFHAEALAALKEDVRALKAHSSAPRVDVAAFKERYGISRKYAIPLLEYLDRERITRRVGDGRIVL